MRIYNKVTSPNKPLELEITDNNVFISSNIQPYTTTLGDYVEEGYTYDYTIYTKDEYIQKLLMDNSDLKNEILDTQSALCDIYEMLDNGGLE